MSVPTVGRQKQGFLLVGGKLVREPSDFDPLSVLRRRRRRPLPRSRGLPPVQQCLPQEEDEAQRHHEAEDEERPVVVLKQQGAVGARVLRCQPGELITQH